METDSDKLKDASQAEIDPDDISVEIIARKRLISEIDKPEELYKCDVCDFSTKHQQNLRIHKLTYDKNQCSRMTNSARSVHNQKMHNEDRTQTSKKRPKKTQKKTPQKRQKKHDVQNQDNGENITEGMAVQSMSPKIEENVKNMSPKIEENVKNISPKIEENVKSEKPEDQLEEVMPFEAIPFSHAVQAESTTPNVLKPKCSLKELLNKSNIKIVTSIKIFKCGICEQTFTNKAELQLHNDHFHGLEVLYEARKKSPWRSHLNGQMKCHHCELMFENRVMYDAHMIDDHKENPYSCLICPDISFPTKTELKNHQNEFHDGKSTKDRRTEWPCDLPGCNYVGETRTLLWTHKRNHTKIEKPWKCDQCDYRCKTKTNLIHHKRTHSEKIFKCHLCDYKSHAKFSLTEHIATHNSEKPFKCDKCVFAAYTQNRLDFHMKSIHLPKGFKCDLCDYETSSNQMLKVHRMQNHTMERPFKCDQCDYAGASSSLLTAHKKIHTTELNFVCTVCSKAFKTQGRLTFHQSVHTGYRPYACEFCDKRFRQSDKLREHIRIHTGEKPFKCPHCDYACVQRGNLKKHINNRHKNIDTAC